MKIVRRKIVGDKSDMKGLIGGLCRDKFVSYVSIRHSVNQLLLAMSIRPKKMFEPEAKAL